MRQECSGDCRPGGNVGSAACGSDAGGDDDNDYATGTMVKMMTRSLVMVMMTMIAATTTAMNMITMTI